MFFLLYYLIKSKIYIDVSEDKKILVLVNFDNIKIWKICYVNWKKKRCKYCGFVFISINVYFVFD